MITLAPKIPNQSDKAQCHCRINLFQLKIPPAMVVQLLRYDKCRMPGFARILCMTQRISTQTLNKNLRILNNKTISNRKRSIFIISTEWVRQEFGGRSASRGSGGSLLVERQLVQLVFQIPEVIIQKQVLIDWNGSSPLVAGTLCETNRASR